MVENKTTEDNEQKAQDYAEAYNLLVKGMEILGAFMGSPAARQNPIVKSRIERAYILLKNDFLNICSKYPDFDNWKENIFRAIPRLGGSYTVDYIQEWAEGEPMGPEDPRKYGGSHAYEDELAMIAEKIFILNPDIKDIDRVPVRCAYRSFSEADDVLKDIEAAEELKKHKITEYTLDWNEKNGKILVNGAYEVMRTNINSGSNTQAIMEQLAKARKTNPKEQSVELEVKLKKSQSKKETLSHIISAELKMQGALKPIFFKGTEDSTLRFRSPVSREVVENERVAGLTDLDLAIMRAKIKAGEVPLKAKDEATKEPSEAEKDEKTG